jgi:hypothetical protein
MQLAGRYTTMNGLGQQPFAYWSPFFSSEAEAKEFCKTGTPNDHHPRCMAAAAQGEVGHAPLTPEEVARLPPDVQALFLPKSPGGMVMTTVVEEQKSLPWVLLGIVALMIAWPALRPQYRRGIAA